MRKVVIARFEYETDVHEEVQVYSKPVSFPAKPPRAFHALCQFATHVNWVEKNALKARIEELEAIVDYLNEHLKEGATQVHFSALATDDEETTLADLIKKAAG